MLFGPFHELHESAAVSAIQCIIRRDSARFSIGRLSHLVNRREGVTDALVLQEDFEFLGDDVAQGHLAGDLDTVHLELAGDTASSFRNLGVADHGNVGCVLSDQRQHRHQVRLTGAIVADHEQAFVIHRFVEESYGITCLATRSAISSEMT